VKETEAAAAGILVSPKQLDEPSLIRAVQRGDQDAFEVLVRAYDQPVLRIAMNLLRSPEDARDVYQEAFLRVYRNIHSFRFDCSFHTWLYRIVTNICLDHLRKRKVRKEDQTVVDSGDGVVDRTESFEERGPEANPERTLLNRELSVRHPDGHADTHRVESPAELLAVLAERFGLYFPPETRFECPALEW